MESEKERASQNEKIAQEIKKRIRDYNRDFQKSLLDGLSVQNMACQFLQNEDDFFASAPDLRDTFNKLKDIKSQEASNNKEFSYFLWKKGKIRKENFPISIKTTDIPKTLDATKEQLYVLTAIDINGDNSKDVYVLTIFEVTKSFKMDSKKDDLNKFLEYPKDFFNSPVVIRYFEDLKYQSEVRNFSHSIFSIYPGVVNHIEMITRDLEKRKYPKNSFIPQSIIPKLYGIRHSSELVLWSLRGIGGKFKECRKEMERSKVNDLKSLLTFIIKGVKTERLEFKTILQTEPDIDLTKYDDKQVISVFSIFINLITNASKSRSYLTINPDSILDVTIKVWSESNDIYVSIKNPCDMKTNVKQVTEILHTQKDQSTSSESKGLSIIRRKVNELKSLGWDLLKPVYAQNEIEIIIKIKKS